MRPVLTSEEVAAFRADVCRVAETLFVRHGVEGVTMRQIAAELGYSSTAAYRYFKNKEEILAAVRALAFNRFCEAIEEATRSSADARRSASNVGKAYLAFALAHPDAYRMMFDVSQDSLAGHPELSQALARARRSMVAYIEPLVSARILDGDPAVLGHMMWAATHGLVMLRLSGVIAEDGELRQLHEKTMSSLAHGAGQVLLASSGAKRLELVSGSSSRGRGGAKKRGPR